VMDRLIRITTALAVVAVAVVAAVISYQHAFELVDISVPMRAQYIEGSAEVTWKMVDSSGRTCFPDRYPNGLVVCIVVRGTPES
jgi:hypothetical protein